MTEPDSAVDCEKCSCRNGFAEVAWRIPDLKWQSYLCPRQHVTQWSWYVLQMHAGFQDGYLPIEGGLADQPYKLMQAIRVVADRRNHNAEKRSRGKKTSRRV